jgi:hypothetical protein
MILCVSAKPAITWPQVGEDGWLGEWALHDVHVWDAADAR